MIRQQHNHQLNELYLLLEGEISYTRKLLETLNRELAAQIRNGFLDDRKAEVLDHLRQTSIDKLAIAKPNYLRPER